MLVYIPYMDPMGKLQVDWISGMKASKKNRQI